MASMNISFDVIPRGTNIKDIPIDPNLLVRIDTGLPFLNFVLSGDGELQGLLPGGVYLFTGTPGAGKSTMALQLLDALTGLGHTAVLNGCEESAAQVRVTFDRLKLKNGFKICNDIFTNRPDGVDGRNDIKKAAARIDRTLLENLGEIRIKHDAVNKKLTAKNKKYMVVVCDSLQSMNDGWYGFASNKNATPTRVTEAMTQFAKDTTTTIILIGHVTKAGDFKGDNTIKHLVDGHIHLYTDEDPNSPTEGSRFLEMQKNRFGPSGISTVLDITKLGLVDHNARNVLRGRKV